MGPSAALGTMWRKTGEKPGDERPRPVRFFPLDCPTQVYFVWTCGRAAARIEMRIFVVVRLAYHRSYWAATASACASHWCGRFFTAGLPLNCPSQPRVTGWLPWKVGVVLVQQVGHDCFFSLHPRDRLRSGRIGVGATVVVRLNFATPRTTRSARATRTRASSPSPPPGRDPSPPCTPSPLSPSFRACSGR